MARKEFENTMTLDEFLETHVSGSHKEYQIPAWERKYFKMLQTLESKLMSSGIQFSWVRDMECYKVEKATWKIITKRGKEMAVRGDYNYVRYLWVDTDDFTYCFGTEDDCLKYSTKSSEVMDAVKEWNPIKRK